MSCASICRAAASLCVLLVSQTAAAQTPAGPRADPRWQKLVADAKDALTHERLADARDAAFDAQRIGDTPETSALSSAAIFGIGLVEGDKAEVSHAALLAEKCLQQLSYPDADLDAITRAHIRLTCLSVAARAYHHVGDNHKAHERAEQCLALGAETVPLARTQAHCRRILEETEIVGYGVLGGTWWKYVVVSANVGYGLRYFPGTRLSSPGGRLDGMMVEGSIGYPNFSLGPLLLRPEAAVRWERLGDELEGMVNADGTPARASSATVLALGARLMLTYPGRLMTIDIGLGAMGAQLRALANDGGNAFYLIAADGTPHPWVSERWAPEITAMLRFGSPELRLGSLAFVLSTFVEVGQVQLWRLTAADGSAQTADFNSLSVRAGVTVRLRIGELKPYY